LPYHRRHRKTRARATQGRAAEEPQDAMSQKLRKMIGAAMLIALIVIYSLVASAIAVARLADSPAWVHLAYFLFTGLAWVLPAMMIVSWMLKPDRERSDQR
jgi:Protein of unknown function (DUF2842)